jgi:hypothetical protein
MTAVAVAAKFEEEEEKGQATMAADDFGALEEKVRRTVELLRSEREARHKAEAEVARLSEGAMADRKRAAEMERELESLRRDRSAARVRVEKMLTQLDELVRA